LWLLSVRMLGISNGHSTWMISQKQFSGFPIIIFFKWNVMNIIRISFSAIFNNFISGIAMF
jgi:hypothetical protein